MTSSGGTSDTSVAPSAEGLHALFLHNILFSGKRFAVPFQAEAGILKVDPFPLGEITTQPDIIIDVTLTSGLAIDNPQFNAYGPSMVEHWYENHPINQGYSWWWDINVSNAARIEVDLTGTAQDVDLYVYHDGADGSTPNQAIEPSEYITGSFSSTSNEKVVLPFPQDGFYRFSAYGYYVPNATATFSMTGHIISGQSITVTPGKIAKLAANQPQSVGLSFTLPSLGEYDVLFLLGPGEDPHGVAFGIPVTYYKPGDIDFNNTQDSADFLGLSQDWMLQKNAPVPIDYDRNGQINAVDLLRFIGDWQN